MAKHKRPIKTFFKTLLLSLVVFALVAAGIFIGCGVVKKGVPLTPARKEDGTGGLLSILDPVPERVNFLVMGADKGGTRPDSIMAGSYMPKEGRLAIVSIPRDTMVTIPESRLNVIKGYNSLAPSDGVMRLNEVYHHAGEQNGALYTVKQVEEILGVSLDYYAKIDLDGFVYLVDAIGGVEFDVPMRMYYFDPTQDLLIDLQPGLQTLDGKAAEGLVRFRKGYADSDISRMANQQAFLKAMAAKMLSSDNIFQSLPATINAGMKYVETNFSVAEAPKYLKYLKQMEPDGIMAFTLPSSRKILHGKDYQVLDEAEAANISRAVFYSAADLDEMDKSSARKSIQVLNGGNTAGMAAQTQDALSAKGFNVASIADYDGEKLPETRIIVKKDGQGQDLLPFFTAGIVEVNPGYTDRYDIVIVLGTLERLKKS